MTTIAALGWVLGALWGAPVDQAPLRVTGFYEAQKPVSAGPIDGGMFITGTTEALPAGSDACVARRWAL